MKTPIAFFDFDGTITFKDTLWEVIKFQKGTSTFYTGLAVLSPWLILMKLKLISRKSVKEKVLTYYYKNTSINEFQNKCDDFITTKLPSLIRADALKQIEEHKKNGVTIVVVSASPQNWIMGWCKLFDITCIATKLEIKNDKLTGKIDGKNCSGEEKVRRIKELYNLEKYDPVYCYGDTNGDKNMLSLATFPYYKPFQ